MNELQDYSKLYPNMPLEIGLFFSQTEMKDGRVIHKEVHSFCGYYQKKYETKEYPQPRVISRMCDILCDNKQLSVIKRAGPDNLNSSYWCSLREEVRTDQILQFYWNKKLSYIVYGFKFIYEDYKKYVLPVEFTNNTGDISLGTCFLYSNGIATARHCIEGAKKIAIQGIPKEQLQLAKFEIHEHRLMDLLYIRFENPLNDTIMFSQNAEVLDEVMTLGYPKIAGYHNFLTAENANVSARFTASIGQIASNAEDIWIREKLFLITAKIRGGNSGGPVVGNNGSVIGVAVNMSEGEGNYDELGYGTVIPVKFIDEMINNQNKTYLDTSKIEFTDFV
ncbi:MAG: serine protease [Chitinophagaceae bacterium]